MAKAPTNTSLLEVPEFLLRKPLNKVVRAAQFENLKASDHSISPTRIPESKSKVKFVLEFGDWELIVDELRARAEELGISVPQFIKRIVTDEISAAEADCSGQVF